MASDVRSEFVENTRGLRNGLQMHCRKVKKVKRVGGLRLENEIALIEGVPSTHGSRRGLSYTASFGAEFFDKPLT
jgi:hypothetical protein